jgi:hypothetical protein
MIYITDDSVLYPDDTFEENVDYTYDIITNSSSLSSTLHDENSDEHDFDTDDGHGFDTNDGHTASVKDDFNGMRIYSSVADKDKHKFFEVTINGVVKFMHKQTAVWYLTKNNNHLSSDRLVRVQKINKQK